MSEIYSPRRDVGEFRKRYKWMALVVVASFAVVLGRAAQLQLFQYKRYAKIARENITKTTILPATRGVILDDRGVVIAANRPAYDVYLTPQAMRMEKDVAKIAALMHLGDEARAELTRRIEAIPERRRTQQIRVFSDITREQLANLETHAAELPGIDVVAAPVRVYPYAGLGAHTIGYLNEVNADDLKQLASQGYRAGDLVGRTGIERAFESTLRGRDGVRKTWTDSRGRHVYTKEPIPGKDVQATLDMGLMKIIDRAFREHPAGAAVVVDVRTGRVRAMYSKPNYDLNEISHKLSTERAKALRDNPYRPLIDKTLFESYFPGSIFKPVSALAALELGTVTPNTRVDCHGFYELGKRRFRCTQVHHEVSLRAAIIQSCNIYFYKLAEQTGLDQIAQYARQFGMGEKTGIGINAESPGFVPTKEWYMKHYDNRFRLGFTLNTAIGQGDLRVTLIQLGMLYAALANGGILYAPSVVEEIRAVDGSPEKEFGKKVRRTLAVTPAHLAEVVEGLVGVVNNNKGTAYDARNEEGVTIAGKTGTAQVSRRSGGGTTGVVSSVNSRDDAWFAGFAPADHPELAIVVLVEHGGGGGKYAAPIAVEVLSEYLGQAHAATP